MSDSTASDLITVEKAIQILDNVAVFPRVIRVPLAESVGLRLAESIRADRDYPPFDKSLMDGYAVRSSDVAGGQANLRVVGEIPAGRWPDRAVQAGEAMAIMTGAPMPPGADGVVPVEDVAERAGVGGIIRVTRAVAPGRYIAVRGSDCAAGQIVLHPGTVIGPAQIAVAASVGAAMVSCHARPRVAVLGTGDELVPVEQVPGPSQIRDSNTHMLVALLTRLGCQVVHVATVRDEPMLIRDAILRAMAYDALFITGGMSMGEYDYVPKILVELGVELKITKLRIKPGKPFVFGVGKESANSPSQVPFIFGLPGNPVSAFVCTLRFAGRLLSRMAGGRPMERWAAGQLTADLSANGPREFYQPALFSDPCGGSSISTERATVTPLTWKGSADVFTLAAANALLVRAENEGAIKKGEMVRVLEI